jgi:ppGpp synthetase/RelA/SpoT-type nucleotidyltranferase
LKEGEPSESDLRLLDEYRRSFGEAYETVVRTIRAELALEPTGRPAKSTTSIVEKLRRESIRLSQIQDIAGCRLIVVDLAEQDRVVDGLRRLFAGAAILDRRRHPSHGYRAVHVIARVACRPVEIQVRTELQDFWAGYSEKLSDMVDPGIKYGGGPERIQAALARLSAHIDNVLEGRMSALIDALGKKWVEGAADSSELQDVAAKFRQDVAHLLEDATLELKDATVDVLDAERQRE